MKNLVIGTLLTFGLISGAQAAGDAEAGQSKVAVCAGCHGADGNSAVPNFPKLAGIGEKYLFNQLKDIKAQKRVIVEMTGLLDGSSEQDLADMAAYFASKKRQGGQADPALVEAGEEIYRAGDASKGLAACTACHGPAGKGLESAGFPALAGQHAAYIESSLVKFAKGERDNVMMMGVAAKMSEADMKAVASYIQGLYQ